LVTRAVHQVKAHPGGVVTQELLRGGDLVGRDVERFDLPEDRKECVGHAAGAATDLHAAPVAEAKVPPLLLDVGNVGPAEPEKFLRGPGVPRSGLLAFPGCDREERICRRAELEFGLALPPELGAPVVERARQSLELADEDVAPVIDWAEALRRQNAVDRESSRARERQ